MFNKACMSVCVHACVCVDVCVCVYVHACTCVHMCSKYYSAERNYFLLATKCKQQELCTFNKQIFNK